MSVMSFIPRRRVIAGIVIATIVIAVFARLLPWWGFMPATAGLALVYVWYESRRVRIRYQTVVESIRKLHGDAVGDFADVRPGEVDKAVYKALKEVATALERKNFQLVEKNIQLLSIKEIGLTLVSS